MSADRHCTEALDAPLNAVMQLLGECCGTVVIALERTYYPAGLEKRGGKQQSPLTDVRLATLWNQIEAALAYCHDHPLMVLVERGVKDEGLLERGNDWFVQSVTPDPAALANAEFNGVLASWKEKIRLRPVVAVAGKSPADLTVGELVSGMKPGQLWGLLGAIAALVAGAFAVGAKLFSP